MQQSSFSEADGFSGSKYPTPTLQNQRFYEHPYKDPVTGCYRKSAVTSAHTHTRTYTPYLFKILSISSHE